MNDKSSVFISQFIDIYRQHPALWKIKGNCYSDRKLKEKVYMQLLELYKSIDGNANVDAVKKKINNLRNSFRKELKKVKASKKSGTSPEGLYVPSLWYYELLLFTANQEEPRSTIGNDEDEESEENRECEDSTPQDYIDILSSPSGPSSESEILKQPSSSISNASVYHTNASKSKPKKKKEELLMKVERQLEINEDEFDISGKNIANKLRSLPKETGIIAEKLIMNVLFEAQLGNSEVITNSAVIVQVKSPISATSQGSQWVTSAPTHSWIQKEPHQCDGETLSQYFTLRK